MSSIFAYYGIETYTLVLNNMRHFSRLIFCLIFYIIQPLTYGQEHRSSLFKDGTSDFLAIMIVCQCDNFLFSTYFSFAIHAVVYISVHNIRPVVFLNLEVVHLLLALLKFIPRLAIGLSN